MLLAIDQGNSDVVFGLWDGSWKHVWRTPTINQPASSYEAKMRQWLLEAEVPLSAANEIVLSSVVPEYKDQLIEFCKTLLVKAPLVLGPNIYKKLGLKLYSPQEIGSDLVANSVAVANKFPDTTSIVVDFGTALTLTTVHNHEILGVAIAPGLQTAVKSLFSHTAQLPEVPLKLPDSVLGHNTVHAIQSGVLHGYVGLVSHMIKKTAKESGAIKVVATGGLSSILEPLHSEFDTIEKNLTLDGLRLINEKLK
ncbi:MAG: type III pantothenate kinase [Cyclobacteriaceae bacterium]